MFIYFGIAPVDRKYHKYRDLMRFQIITLIFIVTQRPCVLPRIDEEATYRNMQCFIVRYYHTLVFIVSIRIIAANENNKV